jgi:uncharacterized membrane protein YhaH (DUF805 family)
MIKNTLEDLFSFHGRLERGGFLIYTGCTVVAALVSVLIAQSFVSSIIFGTGGDATAQMLGVYLGFVFVVLGFMHTAVVVKRLHDLDLSGYWAGSIALTLLLCAVSDKEPGLSIVTFAAAAAYLGLAIVPGTKNVNYYSN